jgi:hypothetical protein
MVRSVSTWGAWTHGTVREDRVQLGSIVVRTRGPLTAWFHRSLHTQYAAREGLRLPPWDITIVTSEIRYTQSRGESPGM